MGLNKLLIHRYNPQTDKMDESSIFQWRDYEIKRFFKNNEKLATHFIEVWSDGKLTNQEEDCERLHPIDDLHDHLFSTEELHDLYTIAIFKIREK